MNMESVGGTINDVMTHIVHDSVPTAAFQVS